MKTLMMWSSAAVEMPQAGELSETAKARMRLWNDALESGAYEQGHGLLESYNRHSVPVEHCCLGVLCRVAIGQGVPLLVEIEDWIDPDIPNRKYGTFNGSTGAAPVAVLAWLFDEDPNKPNPMFASFDQHFYINMNDSWGYTFLDIAEVNRVRFGLGE